MKPTFILTILLILFFKYNFTSASPKDSTQMDAFVVLGKGADSLFHQILLERLQGQFDLRREKLKQSLQSKEELLKRQNQLQNGFLEILGKFPTRTPLNPLVTGTIDYGKYTIEKVVFESRPNFHVTGNFYLPSERNGKIPGIYIMSGHSDVGKATETYHAAATLFALNGFAVLIADPIGQGERFQHITSEGKQSFPGLTLNHTLLDISSMLVGTDVVAYELWDNIRGLDYLASRQEVDESRIGITGNSGGGTQTTYLAGFDERVKAAAPSCYIASFEKKFNTIGSQDGCQQLHDEGLIGLEEQDLLFLAAPTPVRILSAEKDFFALDGARQSSAELKKIYSCLGFPERTDQVSYPGPHGFARPLREASVSWMNRWLKNDTIPVTEPENMKLLAPTELMVTSSGQVLSTFPGEKSVTDINTEKLNDCRLSRKTFLSSVSHKEFKNKVKHLLRLEESGLGGTSVISKGTTTFQGQKIEKIVISRPGGCPLPALFFYPENASANSRVILLVDPQGKTAEFKQGGIIDTELKKGNYVFSVDISGYGELTFDKEKYWNDGFWNANLALYNGKPLFTWQVEDFLAAAIGLKKHLPSMAAKIDLIVKGELCPSALHAVVLSNHFKQASFIQPTIRSWEEVVKNPYIKNGFAFLVPGILTYYDLPDLVTHSKTKISFK